MVLAGFYKPKWLGWTRREGGRPEQVGPTSDDKRWSARTVKKTSVLLLQLFLMPPGRMSIYPGLTILKIKKKILQIIAKCWGWLTGLEAWGRKPQSLVVRQNNRSYLSGHHIFNPLWDTTFYVKDNGGKWISSVEDEDSIRWYQMFLLTAWKRPHAENGQSKD